MTPTYSAVTPATTGNGVASTQVIYAPNIGYTYGITPTSGSITITTQLKRLVITKGIQLLLRGQHKTCCITIRSTPENNQTGRSREVYVTSGTTASFAHKGTLIMFCAGACDNNQMNKIPYCNHNPTHRYRRKYINIPCSCFADYYYSSICTAATITLSGNKDPVDSGEDSVFLQTYQYKMRTHGINMEMDTHFEFALSVLVL